MMQRRSFLKRATLAIGLGAAAAGPAFIGAAQAAQKRSKGGLPFKLAIAGYTFNKFNLDDTLAALKQVDVRYLCIKDFHLPLDSTDAQIAQFHEKCLQHNVTGYGVGPIYMGSEEEVNRAFDYARRVGVKVVVGVPFKLEGKKRVSSPELLQLVDRKVREFDVKYAIHNHGPDMPELFPSAESAIELIKNLDQRVGLCLDIGHQLRDGKDPVKALRKFARRVHDIHIKNVTAPDKSGKGVEMPRGVIDMPAFVKALREVRYSGMCSLEYEKDMNAPLLGVAESVGYFRGLMDTIA